MKKYNVTRSFTYEGKRYYVYADTEKEAIIKMANKIRDLEEGKIKLTCDMTVKDWAEQCINEYKTNLKPISLSNYKSKMNRWIISEIGSLRLKDVKPLHCQKILNGMNGYAKDTINKVNQMMSFIFEKAIDNNLMRNNPASRLTTPQGTKSTRRAITESERAIILKVADADPKYVYFLFMLFCGLRPSEASLIRGMDIKKIDGENMLHIRGTKTDNADRTVPIPNYLMERIPKIGKFDLMFTNANGNEMTTNNRQTLWKHFKRDLNIAMGCKVYRNELIAPYPLASDFTPYCLRHTYCSDLCKKGIDIRTAQYLMGHSDISLTANIYTHTDTETIIKVAKLINE